jgi:hypothetical protein
MQCQQLWFVIYVRICSANNTYKTALWMVRLSGNATLKRREPQTVRTFLIRVAGKLLTGANQP